MRGDKSYAPGTANVVVGQQVRWHNDDGVSHTATQNGGGFDTGPIAPGSTSAPITFNKKGTLDYHCTVHPSMVGKVHVK
jgi:plastocyanin